jgi:hypothetical protein
MQFLSSLFTVCEGFRCTKQTIAAGHRCTVARSGAKTPEYGIQAPAAAQSPAYDLSVFTTSVLQ